MTELRAKAVAAFEEDAARKKVAAIVQFEKDFGVGPDEAGYLGDCRFLFASGDLCIWGYIDYYSDGSLYMHTYKLAGPCGSCTELVLGRKTFSDLAGLGAAIKNPPTFDACPNCKDKDKQLVRSDLTVDDVKRAIYDELADLLRA